MRFAARYIEYAEEIIAGYNGKLPLHHYLKQYFSAQKKFGSRDRKAVSHACYCFFRLGNALKHLPVTDRIVIALYLCSEDIEPWKQLFPAIFPTTKSLEVKLDAVNQLHNTFDYTHLFPLHHHLVSDIDIKHFCKSHLVQPDLFLRVRPGKLPAVFQKLKASAVNYTIEDNDTCLRLSPNLAVDGILQLNKEVVVQDRSSQQVSDLMKLIPQKPAKLWDCCAASGGKAILAYDILQPQQMLASDVRPSIIQNLEQRLKNAGVPNYRTAVIDLSSKKPILPHDRFDLIICDVPCSGSGTWSRSPEQLRFFEEASISQYAGLQRSIVSNARKNLAKNGLLLYITCSVFKEENDENVQFAVDNLQLVLVSKVLIEGYDNKADTMFAALFINAG